MRLRMASILMSGLVLCSVCSCNSTQPVSPPNPCEFSPSDKPMIVKAVKGPLTKWTPELLIMEITPKDAQSRQFARIRGRVPEPLSPNDIWLRVYMARDTAAWYLAIDVRDDNVLGARDPNYPYRGDCFELFLAGSQDRKLNESMQDFKFHVENPEGENQASFMQLVLPAPPAVGMADYLPEYRTDLLIRRRAEASGSGFQVTIKPTHGGWRGEARIPFALFEPSVASAFRSGAPLKIGVDYLDYDNQLAPPHGKPPDYGFRPDNVFSLYPSENNNIIPKCMQTIIFQ